MNRKWVLVFDWDGTLVATLEIKIRNAGALFEEMFGISHASVEASYRRHSGLPRSQLFRAIGKDVDLDAFDEDTYQLLSQRFTEKNRVAFAHLKKDQIVPHDTLHVLEALYAKGYPLFISSAAAPDEVRQVAASLQLDHFFAAILGSEPGFSKGADHLNYIRNFCNTSLSHIVFIGDEPADILLGRQAGVLTIAKAGTFPPKILIDEGADGVITSFRELIPWLDQQTVAEV